MRTLGREAAALVAATGDPNKGINSFLCMSQPPKSERNDLYCGRKLSRKLCAVFYSRKQTKFASILFTFALDNH